MEEAESLCSNIGIFIHGKIKCIGSPADLKHRLGDGYYIHIACTRKDNAAAMKEVEDTVLNYMRSALPGIVLLNQLNGTLNFEISSKSANLSSILEKLVPEGKSTADKKAALEYIEDWGVENTTLEQVFVSITQDKKF
jgi:ABC-type multidrug transport system ATPase subunit